MVGLTTNAARPPSLEEVFAARLKEIRECRGLSLRGLSAKLAEIGYVVDHKAIDRLERGERRATVNDLGAIGAVLNCSPLDLLAPADSVPHPGRDPEIKGEWVKPMAREIQLAPGLVTYVGTLRTWLGRGWPLRSEDNREEFFGEAPFDEEEARRKIARRTAAGLPADLHHSAS